MPTLSRAPSLTLSPVSTRSGNLIHRPFPHGLLSLERCAGDKPAAEVRREVVLYPKHASSAPRLPGQSGSGLVDLRAIPAFTRYSSLRPNSGHERTDRRAPSHTSPLTTA